MMSENDKDWGNPAFRDVYAALYLADALEADNRMMDWLNHNGFCNLTVCPMCRVDDFTHVEGCKMGERLDRWAKTESATPIRKYCEAAKRIREGGHGLD